MTGATALAAAIALALPAGQARYRLELGGEPIGATELSVRCAGEACRLRWQSALRLPREAGGAVTVRRVELDVDPAGRARAGEVRHFREGERWTTPAAAGRVPAALAEVVLLATPLDGERCVDAFEEESGETGRACARPAAGGIEVDVLGTRERVVPGRDGFPAELAIPAEDTRFVRDDRARPPAREPALYGTRVPGPADPAAARSFCDVARDPAPSAPPVAVPPAAAAGASCREKTDRYLQAVRRAGLAGRTAAGVAFDGRGFVWHEWAEVQVDGAWIPVDPTFGELPAAGPRFTVARWADHDPAARLAGGRRILACWGRASVLGR